MDSSQENNNSNMANDSDEAEKEPMEEIEEEEDEEMEEDLVSDDAFWHVEASWLNGFEPGMNIEIVHYEKKYWVAKIINVFSNLLSIKWAGCSSDSWIDVKANKCFPYGYLKHDHEYTFEAPDKVPITYDAACDYEVEYTDDKEPVDKSKPLSLYLSGGLNPAHVFKVGIILEISHRLDPDKHWFAEVKRNVGGRLFVKWVHSCDKEPDSEPNTPVEFWIFYSHPRIYHLGYAKEEGDISYEPVFLYNSWVSDIAKILSAQDAETTQTAKYLLNLAKSKRPPLLDPSSIKNSNLSDLALTFPPSMGKLVPVIIQNKGDDHIIVSSQTGKMVSCYPNDDNVILLPSSWAEEHDFSLYNFEDATNDLRNYLNKHKANEAPIKLIDDDDRIQKFKVNHKLQVVHPHDPTMICEGIVTRLTPPLVWVEISADLVTVLPYNSTDLYPSGFCEDNSYSLTKLLTSSSTSSTTKKLVKRRDESNGGENSTEKSSETKAAATIPPEPSTSRSHVCPRIYFNHKCFTGPLLSKTKIRELPRFVGPGPVLLVMQEVIAKIISVAYVPPRVLNEMSSRSFVELLSKNKLKSARTTNFKAKYNKKAFRDEIIVISDTKDVAEYCKLVCGHLKCCYHLFGPDLYDGDDCPSHCRGLRKTNKVLKRAIYYRQKAAKTKVPADPVGKQVDSPAGSSSGTKELESSENIEPEVETKGRGRRTREAKETIKQGKVSPINANPTTATNTTNQPTQLMTRKLSTALRKGGDDENSQENCPSDKSGDFREESPSDTNFRESTNLSRSKRNDKTYERSIPKSSSNNTNNNTNNINNNNNSNTNNNTNSNNNSSSNNNNKRKYDEIMETVSSNGSENSLDHHLVSQPNRHQHQNRRRQHIAHLEKKMVRRLPPPPPPPRKSQKPDASTSYKFDPNDRLHPVNWSTRDVSNYFRDNRCYTLSDTLFEHEIDGLALLLLDNKSQWMNLMLGFSRSNNLDDVNKLSQIIRKLKSRFFPGASQNYIQLVINKVALQRQTRQPLNC